MQARLNSSAEEVVVRKTVARPTGMIKGVSGRERKIFTNTTREVLRWRIDESPSGPEYGKMPSDKSWELQSWALDQRRKIQEAYERNLEEGLVGGNPVVVSEKAQKLYGDHPHYDRTAKVGEFSGVITGARQRLIKHSAKYSENSDINEIAEIRSVPEITEQLRLAGLDLINTMAERKEETRMTAFSKEELLELYKAERIIFYILTRGVGVKQREYEHETRSEVEASYRELTREGVGRILRLKKKIGDILDSNKG